MDINTEKQYKELYEEIKNWKTDDLINRVQKMLRINDEDFKIISFCILLIFWTELMLKNNLTDTILNSQEIKKRYPELINLIFDETTFRTKIKIMKFVINKGRRKKEFKDFFSFCQALNNLRNKIFHVKLDKIQYKGLAISDINTQRKMLHDLIDARLKMKI